MSPIIATAVQCLRDEAQALLDLIPSIGSEFQLAVELILQCRGKVIVTGVGKSGHIGAKIAATLSSTGTPSFFINPLDAFHGDLGVIGVDDVVLAISNSGETDELLRFFPYLLARKIPVIGMSGNPASLLAQYSSVHLSIEVDKEACPMGLAPTTSTTVTLALGDALACALIVARDFKASDFAQFHPGGSVTDGDIRRAMERFGDNFFKHTVAEVMSPNPKSVDPETKVVKIDEMMKQHKIHSVLVVGEQGNLLGIVDSFCTML